jgi:dTDP-glucose pyrophosphorylase
MLQSNLLVRDDISIQEALSVIEKSYEKIAIVINESDIVIGSVTDGDIRRGLLSGKNLSDPISEIMNKNPALTIVGEILSQYINDIKNNLYKHIIIVNKNGTFNQVLSQQTINAEYSKPGQAIIMAGGKGTRLGELTKELPKPMVDIAGKPMIEHLLNKLRIHNYKKIIIAVNYKKEIIKNYLKDGKDFGVEIQYLEEEHPLGTAGPLSLLNPNDIEEDFIVTNADLITNFDFLALSQFHKNNNNIATICVREYQYIVPFGIVKVDKENNVVDILEKPIQNYLISSGIYAFKKEVLNYLEPNIYLDMPDLIKTIKDRHKVGTFIVFEDWHDVGRIEDLKYVRENIYA